LAVILALIFDLGTRWEPFSKIVPRRDASLDCRGPLRAFR
jgi:hypothetical protein